MNSAQFNVPWKLETSIAEIVQYFYDARQNDAYRCFEDALEVLAPRLDDVWTSAISVNLEEAIPACSRLIMSSNSNLVCL